MTVRQKQCLLCYLGHYAGAIDGIWGPASMAAEGAFRRAAGLAEGADLEKALRAAVGREAEEVFWEEIEFFTREEFRCKCGKFCDGYPAEPKEKLVRLAEQVRRHFDRPAIVVSGLRCRQHNAACGGVANSQHMYGEAVDLNVTGVSGRALLAYVSTLPGVRYAYRIEGSENVHFDIPKEGRENNGQ